MNPIAMTALLAVTLGAFAFTALRRWKLLQVGAPENRFDHLLERMAGGPGYGPTLFGWALVVQIFALPFVGLAILLATVTPDSDVTPFIRLVGIGAIAHAGGVFLLWAMRAQIKMPKYPLAGLAHYGIFLGFAILLVRTIMLVGRGYDPNFNLWVLDPNGPMPWALLGKGYNLMKEAVIALVIFGVITFIRFRLLDKTKRLAYGWHAWVVLGTIATMMLADLVYDGGEMASTAARTATERGMTPGAVMNELALHEAAPLAWVFGRGVLALGLSAGALHVIGLVGFWVHVTLVWLFLNYLPYGKHFHVITALFNIFFRDLKPAGRLPPMGKTSDEVMEKVGAAAELPNPTDAPVGVAQIEHFTWKALLDFYTCTECGRCSDNCPAHRTGKLLSPKHFTIDLRNHLYGRAQEFSKRPGGPRGEGVPPSSNIAAEGDASEENKPAIPTPQPGTVQRVDLVPGVIDPDVLWGCTTCRACEEQCPVMITYVDKIVEMRRNLVLVKGEFPHELQKTFSALETNGNPWNITRMDRGAWSDGLDVPLISEHKDAEVLYWVGCAASYDDSAKKIARATARILKAAGVDFAILGSEETCTGDPARRAGNEYLYMMLAEQNVATLNGYAPKKIITTCPHCFNTLLNEYPDLGGKYEVVHHSDFLLGLLIEGKIKPKRGVTGTVVFHDSCYLGRYNNVYDPPREVLKRIPGLKLVEAAWSKDRGLCCGAGGAQMWMEEQNNDRVNKRRTLQLLETGATTIASGCPFCHTMLTDGLKAFEGEKELENRAPVQQLDIAVILERSLALDSATVSDPGHAAAPADDAAAPATAEA